MRIELQRAATVTAVAGLLLTGCASGGNAEVSRSSSLPASDVTTDLECGTSAFLTWVPGGGQATRRAVLEEMLSGHRTLQHAPGRVEERSTPEDVIRTLEAALVGLPIIEENAAPHESVMVPATDAQGRHLGQFLIEWDGKSYIITEYAITHTDGVPCLDP
jgi:hypothetical protein